MTASKLICCSVAFGALSCVSMESLAESIILEEQQNPKAGSHSSGINAEDDIERKYDRFHNGSDLTWFNFIGNGYDWSGVGRSTDGGLRWATAISPQFFLTVSHAGASEVGPVRFYHDTGNPNDFEDHTVLGAFNSKVDPNSDLAAGRLATGVSDKVAVYPICLMPSQLVGQELWMWGHSASPSSIPKDGQGGVIVVNDGNPITNRTPTSQKLGMNTIHALNPAITTPVAKDYHNTYSYRFDVVPNPVTRLQKAQFMVKNTSSGAPTFMTQYENSGTFYFRGPALFGLHTSYDQNTVPWGSVYYKFSHYIVDFTLAFPNGATGIDTAVPFLKDELVVWLDGQQQGTAPHERDVATFVTLVADDFDGNSNKDSLDLDILVRDVRMRGIGMSRGYNWLLDVNSDGSINDDDVDTWLGTNKRGDANLDGAVNFADWLVISGNWNGTGKSWSTGDFTGDGSCDNTDLQIYYANQD